MGRTLRVKLGKHEPKAHHPVVYLKDLLVQNEIFFQDWESQTKMGLKIPPQLVNIKITLSRMRNSEQKENLLDLLFIA
jgi:hypothetical protein